MKSNKLQSTLSVPQMALPVDSTNRCVVVRISAHDRECSFMIPADYVLELFAWLGERQIQPK